MLIKTIVAKKKIFVYLFKEIKVLSHTCVSVFFLHKITVSRPTRSITSRTRSCFCKIRAGTSVFFDDEDNDFFFHHLLFHQLLENHLL
jgi:hypothetical protein